MRKVFVLLVVGLISILLFSSVPLTLATYDECETDPSQCQCSFNTCLGGCLSIDPITIAGCAVSCGSCFASASIPGCIVCAACLGVGVTALVNCIGTCQGDPCAYGYVCRPCEIKSPINRRCYDSDTYEVEICRCDGQGWDNWRRIDCPSGKKCCPSDGKCYECCTDPDCGANAYCSGGTCHCNEGYHNCDGDWSNGCECPPGMWCEDSECVPEASTLILFAVGLLFLTGYIGLKRRKTK